MKHSTLKISVIPLREVPSNDEVDVNTSRRPVVLVVDDERVIADSLSIILSRSGFSALTAYDGASALALAKAGAPDLLLSDVMLGPGIDGVELALAVVAACPECKVLLFSGHAATKGRLEEAREQGHLFTLLSKPLHPSDLLQRIQGSLARPVMSREAERVPA